MVQMFFDFIYSEPVWATDRGSGMTDSVSEIRALDKARRLLGTIKSPPATVAIVEEVLSLLDEVDRTTTAAFTRPARRGAAPVVYTVQTTEMGESLAEHRPDGSSRPFRCPKPLYDALVNILTQADRPLSTDEIAAAAEQVVGYRPGDHQYRVPLRLFLHVQPPLLVRSRAKYSILDPKSFAAEAARLWSGLRAK